MNALQPAMIKSKVFAVPTVLKEEREERQTAKGGVLFYVRLTMEYKFFAEDGSFVTATVIGEAMDSGDKATNKAMSIAYKYACFQVFSIPTEELQDPDAATPEEVKPILVDEVKIKVLKDKMAKKGVKAEQIFSRYKVNCFDELTVGDFMKACSALDKMADVEDKQVDLGL